MAQRGGPVGAARPRIAGSHPPPIWAAFSQRPRQRKAHPNLDAQNGMHFPDGGPSGKRIPESGLRTGCAFQTTGQRKTHPILRHDSGTQFPLEASTGKCNPCWSHIPGHSFRFKQKAPARDGAGAKGAAYTVDVERGRQSAMADRALPYPRLRTRLYGVSTMGRSGRSLPSNAR